MTPKEKAKQLFNQFYLYMSFKDVKLTACLENPQVIKEMEELSAKQCAIITCDELILQSDDTNFGGFKLYWEKVKEEINNL